MQDSAFVRDSIQYSNFTNHKNNPKYSNISQSRRDSTYFINPADSPKPTTKSYSNFHLKDIFGNYHRMFRPFFHTTMRCIVRILPDAYAYTNDDIVFTKYKKILISHTDQRIHSFEVPKNRSFLRNIPTYIRIFAKWIRFVTTKSTRVNGSVALLTRHYVNDNFAHFLREVIGGFYQLRLAKIEPDFYIFPTNTKFQREMIEILGIDMSRIIPCTPNRLICAKNLIIPTILNDYEIVEYRNYLHFRAFPLPLFCYLDIYRHIAPPPNPQHKVFLTRPIDSNRNIVNQSEVESIFQSFGYRVISPDNLSLKEQMEVMSSVKILASMHGAGLSGNLLFTAPNITVFEIFSQYYHDSHSQITALAKHCKYFYMVGETSDISMHPQKESVYIDKNLLQIALQTIEKG